MTISPQCESFLTAAGWGAAQRAPMAADFSTRRFVRLRRTQKNDETAILMMADRDQRTGAFVALAAVLREAGLAAPEIFASDIQHGFVLMQDFGDDKIGARLDVGASAAPFDAAAAQALACLHAAVPAEICRRAVETVFTAPLFVEQLDVMLDAYFPLRAGRAATAGERAGAQAAWASVLAPLDALPRSLLLRDFMPDNAMWLSPPLRGHALGLLDFQDGGEGCVAYDIASWCEEVRRDGGLSRLAAFAELYGQAGGALDVRILVPAAQIYAAQRHARILGRLIVLNRPALIPRVERALSGLLSLPALKPVQDWFTAAHLGMTK